MTRNEQELPDAHEHEPSYYEIALTNRQVVGAFVVLLVCVLAAFLGGLWVGRESASREAEADLRNAPPPAQVAAAGEKTDKLDFFSVPQGSTQIEPQDAPKKGTLREQLDRNDQTLGTPPVSPAGDGSEAGSGEEAVPAPAPEPTPAPPVKKPAGAGPGKPAAGETRADAKKGGDGEKPPGDKKAGKNAREERGDPEPPKGSFVVQVFSTSERDQALKVRNRLTGGGEKAYLSPVKSSGGTMYRVRIGPFTSRDAAQKVADKVRKGYKLDTWVTQ